MVYRVIGLMSGSSLDGLDIAYVHLQETGGKWSFDLLRTACYPYSDSWKNRLRDSVHLSAEQYQLLHTAFGHYMGGEVNRFIGENNLLYQVQLIGSHGHTSFHLPSLKMTAQLGDGAALAASTGINVVSDLRSMDIALGGQGAPIVPIGEKLLFPEHSLFLNIGGIANLSSFQGDRPVGFDVCPANRVLDMLSARAGQPYDEFGRMAAGGKVDALLLEKLQSLEYYQMPPPKSLANSFGTDIIFPLIQRAGCSDRDALRTYTEHIVLQVKKSALDLAGSRLSGGPASMLVTGGGAFNQFLMDRLREVFHDTGIDPVLPAENIISYKEALIMALMGVLRWREENNVLCSVTGASRNSIGGAVWMGQEA